HLLALAAEPRSHVDNAIKLFSGSDSAFGPQRSALLLTALDRSQTGSVQAFELLVLIAELLAALDPVVLTGHRFLHLLELFERLGAPAWSDRPLWAILELIGIISASALASAAFID